MCQCIKDVCTLWYIRKSGTNWLAVVGITQLVTEHVSNKKNLSFIFLSCIYHIKRTGFKNKKNVFLRRRNFSISFLFLVWGPAAVQMLSPGCSSDTLQLYCLFNRVSFSCLSLSLSLFFLFSSYSIQCIRLRSNRFPYITPSLSALPGCVSLFRRWNQRGSTERAIKTLGFIEKRCSIVHHLPPGGVENVSAVRLIFFS